MESILRRLNLNKLSKREKTVIGALLAIIGLFVLVQLIVVPLFARKDRIQSNIRAKVGMLAEMQRMQADYNRMKNDAKNAEARFGNREQGFTLFSFLDKLAGQIGVKDRVSYMKPSKIAQKDSPYTLSRVEMKLEGISLEQLTKYIHGIETSSNIVSIQKMSISKKDNDQGLLSAVLQVETIEI
jgi:general secretion pathway protein M